MALFRKLLPFSRMTLLVWGWRNRASVLEWATFGLRAVQSAAAGDGTADARAEFRLRANLSRDRRTRGALVDVRVEGGVAHLAGRVTPEVHAVVQDIAVGTRGITRLDDRLTHATARGGLLKRRAAATA
jgi:osmotically-inducible protein OsmY